MYVINVRVLSPVIASITYFPELTFLKLKKEYSEKVEAIVKSVHSNGRKLKKRLEEYSELLQHIDRAFYRVYCPIHKFKEPCILGSAVRGAINSILPELRGVEGLVIYGLFFNEASIDISGVKRTKPDGTKTVIVYEYVVPDSIGHIVIETSEKVLELIRKLIGREISIGAWKNKGFGRVGIINIKEPQKSKK